MDKLIARLRGNLLVRQVHFKSSQKARADFIREFPDLKFILTEFEDSPFPASLEIAFHPQYNFDTKVSALISEVSQLPLVESREVNLEWAHKIVTVKRFISLVGAFLSTILIFVSVFIIYNVINEKVFKVKFHFACLYFRYIEQIINDVRQFINLGINFFYKWHERGGRVVSTLCSIQFHKLYICFNTGDRCFQFMRGKSKKFIFMYICFFTFNSIPY